MDWRKLLNEATDEQSFNKVLDDYFRWRFAEEKARGAVIIETDDWRAGDENTPFFGLCQTLAETVKQAHEFRPFIIELMGSGQQCVMMDNSLYGLRIEYGSCSIMVCLASDTSKVTISYSWP